MTESYPVAAAMEYKRLRDLGEYTPPNMPRRGADAIIASRKAKIAELEKQYPDFRYTYDRLKMT